MDKYYKHYNSLLGKLNIKNQVGLKEEDLKIKKKLFILGEGKRIKSVKDSFNNVYTIFKNGMPMWESDSSWEYNKNRKVKLGKFLGIYIKNLPRKNKLYLQEYLKSKYRYAIGRALIKGNPFMVTYHRKKLDKKTEKRTFFLCLEHEKYKKYLLKKINSKLPKALTVPFYQKITYHRHFMMRVYYRDNDRFKKLLRNELFNNFFGRKKDFLSDANKKFYVTFPNLILSLKKNRKKFEKVNKIKDDSDEYSRELISNLHKIKFIPLPYKKTVRKHPLYKYNDAKFYFRVGSQVCFVRPIRNLPVIRGRKNIILTNDFNKLLLGVVYLLKKRNFILHVQKMSKQTLNKLRCVINMILFILRDGLQIAGRRKQSEFVFPRRPRLKFLRFVLRLYIFILLMRKRILFIIQLKSKIIYYHFLKQFLVYNFRYKVFKKMIKQLNREENLKIYLKGLPAKKYGNVYNFKRYNLYLYLYGGLFSGVRIYGSRFDKMVNSPLELRLTNHVEKVVKWFLPVLKRGKVYY
jgi:hypothetical protein